MGTNYYLRLKESVLSNKLSPTLKKEIIEKTELHIGKASCGWKFLFQEQKVDGEVLNSKEKWQKQIADENWEIRDEYDDLIEEEKFWNTVNVRQNKNHISHCEYARENPYYFHIDYYQDKDGYEFDVTDFC